MINIYVPAHVKNRLQGRWLTLPNILTLSRLVSTPFIVAGMLAGWWRLVFALFVAAGLTDACDGYIARRLNAQVLWVRTLIQ